MLFWKLTNADVINIIFLNIDIYRTYRSFRKAVILELN